MQSIAPKEAGRLGDSKVDRLAAGVFIEVLCLVKFIIFFIKEGLCKLVWSDMQLLNPFFSNPDRLVMKLVILTMIVASVAHLDKTTLCLVKGLCIKVKDKLLR